MENTEHYYMVLVTTDTPERARTLAHTLVQEQLAACCNLLPGITSVYSWQGAVEENTECLLLIKTRQDKLHVMEERIRTVHSYSVPEIIALPLTHASAPYLLWMQSVL